MVKFETHFQKSYETVANECIRILSKKYSIRGAHDFLFKKQKKFILPFVGLVDEEKCKAVKYASGLHIQCDKTYEDGSCYCEKHAKEHPTTIRFGEFTLVLLIKSSNLKSQESGAQNEHLTMAQHEQIECCTKCKKH